MQAPFFVAQARGVMTAKNPAVVSVRRAEYNNSNVLRRD